MISTAVVCTDIDQALTIAVSLFCLVVFLMPLRQFPSALVGFLVFLFFLVGYNFLALTYIPDDQHWLPDWLSIFLPVLLAAISTCLMFFARWVLYALLTFLVLMMAAHMLIVWATLAMALVLSLFFYCCLRVAYKGGAADGVENIAQSLVLSFTTAIIVAIGLFALVSLLDDDNPTDVDRCAGKTNSIIICDFQCGSMSSDSRITWTSAWIAAVAVLAVLRFLLVNTCCGFGNWAAMRQKCKENRKMRYNGDNRVTSIEMSPPAMDFDTTAETQGLRPQAVRHNALTSSQRLLLPVNVDNPSDTFG